MALVCSSCHFLSRGLLRRASFKALSYLKTREISGINKQFVNNSFLVNSRPLFTRPSVLNVNNANNEDKLKAEAKDESLTEEERQVLEEIEEEERRIREGRGRTITSSATKSDDYTIWDEAEETPDSKRLLKSLSDSHVPFQDRTRVIQDVIEEMWNPLPEPEEEEVLPILYPHGKTGVFDLGELVDLLREENGEEIVAIKIPKELDYADHMVIVTVRNTRQLLALATFVRKRFKMKELKPTDRLPFLDRSRQPDGWIAMDLGNIILQLFLQDVRDYYDLETLWTVGPQFDDLYNLKDTEIVQLLNSLQTMTFDKNSQQEGVSEKWKF